MFGVLKIVAFALFGACFFRASFVIADPISDAVVAAMNTSVNPCQDFYQFSCGGWIAATTLPPDESRYDRSFSIVEKHNRNILLSILKDPSNSQKLSDFYNSCMNTETIDSLGFSPAVPWLQFVSNISNIDDLMYAVGVLHSHGISNVLFGIYVTIDSENPSLNIAGFSQGGLALPYPGLYLDNSDPSRQLRQQYVKHISNMFQLIGENSDNAAEDAQNVLAFETMIANFTLPPDALVDPFFVYNKIDVTGLAAISPNIAWNTYFQGLNHSFNQATVDVPPYFSNLSSLIPNTQYFWSTYLRWQVIHTFAPYLSKDFVSENFAFFGQILNGVKEQSPRWEQCVEYVDSGLGELLGSFFVEEAFNGDSRELATQILQGIEGAMKANIQGIDWMDDVTRQRALVKLSLVSNLIGSPTNPQNYSDVDVDPNQFFQNVLSANVYATDRQLNTIEQPSDKNQWGMTAPTVNAYYDPTRNQMVFPAGILQQPFFNASYPVPMNSGGIGMVMGHELTHGFDNQGRDYNGNGVLVNWWLNATSERFDKRVQCVIDQYSQFQPIPGVYINGKLTQGENIADMGGIKNSYNSYMKLVGPQQANSPSIVPGLSNIELFFVSFAQGWCEVATDEAIKNQVATNPHSPAKFRVLGPLINLPQFAQTFNCPSGSPMNPKDRCEVW